MKKETRNNSIRPEIEENNNEIIGDIISQAVFQTVNTTIHEMRKNGLAKDRKTPFQKVEYLLKNYTSFKQGIENKQEKIADIKQYGLGSKSKSITSFGGANGTIRDEEKIVQEAIDDINRSMSKTQHCISMIDDALLRLVNEKYYQIIPMWYFKGQTREVIAEHLDIDTSTVSRNKTELVEKLAIDLFSDEIIGDLFH